MREFRNSMLWRRLKIFQKFWFLFLGISVFDWKHRLSRLTNTDYSARPRASPFGRNQKIKERLLRIRRMFFASAFLFAASFSCEGGEKRTTAKNKRPKVPFWKKSHNILRINRLQLTVLKTRIKNKKLTDCSTDFSGSCNCEEPFGYPFGCAQGCG
jgi:hypothetical protein